ncbi:MAG: hypothetical protein ABSH22_00410 [Tepidisphaeraceae bacterium]|jgi:hypothetical protein
MTPNSRRSYLPAGIFAVALALEASTVAWAQATTQPSGGVGANGATLVDRLAEIFNIPHSDADPFANLRDVASGDEPKVNKPAAEEFAKSMAQGGDFDFMTRLAAQTTDLSSRFSEANDARWKYGWPIDRNTVVKYLWAKAQDKLAPSDIAARDARAAALLGAADEFFNDVAEFAFVVRDEKKFDAIAGLDPSQIAALHKLIADTLQGNKAYGEKMGLVFTLQSRLVKSAASEVDAKTLDEFLAAITQLRAVSQGMSGREYESVVQVWQVANVAAKKQDAQAQGRIDQYLGDWVKNLTSQADGTSTPLYRWLEIARTQVGPVP